MSVEYKKTLKKTIYKKDIMTARIIKMIFKATTKQNLWKVHYVSFEPVEDCT